MNEKFLYRVFERLARDTLIFTYPRCVYYKGRKKLYVGNDYNYLIIDVILELLLMDELSLTKEEQIIIHEIYEEWLKGVLDEVW